MCLSCVCLCGCACKCCGCCVVAGKQHRCCCCIFTEEETGIRLRAFTEISAEHRRLPLEMIGVLAVLINYLFTQTSMRPLLIPASLM